MENYRRGLLLNFAIYNNVYAFHNLICGTVTFYIGSFMEIGEVDVLTLLVSGLGPAEVATWALVGLIWKLLESSVEGLGEAASVRIALLLSHYQPILAQRLATKVLYNSIILALLLTCSILYVLGSLIVVSLTIDSTLQIMLNDLLFGVGLATISMIYSQASWSIIEAQGRVNTNFIIVMIRRWILTIPLSAIFIFAGGPVSDSSNTEDENPTSLPWDLRGVTGALFIGHTTASCIYAFVVLRRSDWERLSKEIQDEEAEQEVEEEEMMPIGTNGDVNYDEEDDDDDYSYDDDDDDDSSFGIL